MSLFRRETLYVGMESTGIAIVKLAGGRRPKVLADVYVPLVLDPHAPGLSALAEHLAAPAFAARRVHVVLADTLVRYFIADRPRGVRNLAELHSLIAARFEEQFGLPASDWNIAGDLAPAAQRYLACAMPRVLCEAVRSLVAGAGLQLTALEPYAISEINRWRRRVPGGPMWFAATRPDAVTLGYWNRGGWQGMRTHAGTADLEQSLGMLAERDSLLHGVADVIPIACTGLTGHPVGVPAIPGIKTIGATLWPGRGEAWSRTYRAALSGVWP